ncbi:MULTISPECIES: HNH endonuclease [unclassified Tenacibaculum]|uniref:HNH endonuclease n=1 Tax=unclassified Tenacibaculum TaxID=2635139 RepID=UPI001F3E7D9D|nr:MULTISPECIES: hypothetical protein [unclassified Tenacibaculum]MCF2875073.1 hypothetical protein [Tenacibaculum sp. Cn5-1]MCF2935149.1 hypothetical protein [Tenacibaculum sp. Cn5-34]MCG7511409.1 hypothetical protein [Tenacibaculum sp. Cn5-46]
MKNMQQKKLVKKAHGSYGGLLLTSEWREKREEILKRDGNKCRVCNSEEELQVHHRQYHYSLVLRKFRKPWEYPNRLLISLCKKCHQKGHNKFEVPIKYI